MVCYAPCRWKCQLTAVALRATRRSGCLDIAARLKIASSLRDCLWQIPNSKSILKWALWRSSIATVDELPPVSRNCRHTLKTVSSRQENHIESRHKGRTRCVRAHASLLWGFLNSYDSFLRYVSLLCDLRIPVSLRSSQYASLTLRFVTVRFAYASLCHGTLRLSRYAALTILHGSPL